MSTIPSRDYVPAPAGGSLTGYRPPDSGMSNYGGGFANTFLEANWAGAFVFFIIYLVFVFLDPYFKRRAGIEIEESLAQESSGAGGGGGMEQGQADQRPPMTAVSPQTVEAITSQPRQAAATLITATSTTKVERKKPRKIWYRLSNLGNAARDAFLIYFATTLVTQAGHGYTQGSFGIQWAVFGLLVIWGLAQLATPYVRRILDALLLLPIIILLIIVWGLAWRPATQVIVVTPTPAQ